MRFFRGIVFIQNTLMYPLSYFRGLKMKLFLCALGLVLILEGLPYFAFPEKMKEWMLMVQEIPDSRLRGMGFVAMALGLLLAYSFKQ